MRPGDIPGRRFYVVTEINHRIIVIYPRSTRRARIVGLFSLSHEQNKARFNYAVAREQRRSQFKRNLYGFYTDFIELLRKKSLGEIFFKMLLRKKYIQLPGN